MCALGLLLNFMEQTGKLLHCIFFFFQLEIHYELGPVSPSVLAKYTCVRE